MHFRAGVLRLENFLSHADTTLSLAQRGVVLLNGAVLESGACDSNGSGKTALLPDGLVYALFGRTLRGARGKSVVRDARGGSNGRNCLVTLTGWDDTGATVVLTRPQQHARIVRPMIQVGAETYQGDDEVQRVVHMLLGGLDFTTFTSVLVFGKGDVQFFPEQTDAQRKHVLGRLLNFEEIDGFYQATQDAMAVACTREMQLAQDYRTATDTITGLQQMETQLLEQERTRDAARAEKLISVSVQRRDAVAKLSTAKKTQKKLAPLLDAQQLQRHGVMMQECETQEEVEAVALALHKQEGACHTLKDRREERYARIVRVDDLVGDECPTCCQQVTSRAADVIRPLLQEEWNSAMTQLLTAEAERDALRDRVTAVKERHIDARSARIALDAALTQNEHADRDLRVLIMTYTNTIVALDQRTQDLQAPPADTGLASVQQQIETLQDKLKDIQVQRKHLEKSAAFDQYWKVAFGVGGIRSMLLDEKLPTLNQAAQWYSEGLTDGEIRVQFNTQSTLASGERREKFAVDVMIQGHPSTYELCSAGQRRRVDVITTLALSDLAAQQIGGPFNVLVLDEIFDGLDSTGMERAVHLLLQMKRESIFVVTHDQAMAALFPTTETVEYRHGVSRLLGAP